MKRWTIQVCEYPGCEIIEEAGSVTHSHPHRTLKSPPHTETPLSDPIEVVSLSEVKKALEDHGVKALASELGRLNREAVAGFVEVQILDIASQLLRAALDAAFPSTDREGQG